MELKVWVEGIQRIVCGVNDSTTCQDVVFALAHAIGKSGKFTLIERWRNNERLLSPTEKPIKVLLKWGEYSNDVQFILQYNDPSAKIQMDSSLKLQNANKIHSHTNSDTSVCNSSISDMDASDLSSRSDNSLNSMPSNEPNGTEDLSKSQYKDLLDIVNFQKMKISQIETDLKKINTEIEYLDNRNKDYGVPVDSIIKEMMNFEYIFQINEDQIQKLSNLENESETVKEEEKYLKSEIQGLRTKLAESETDLIQHKNKIQLLNEDLLIDQRKLLKTLENERNSYNTNLLFDVEKLQKDIEESKHKSAQHDDVAETLKKELFFMESAINEKKKQIEQLIGEMKEANLRSLLMNPVEEVRYLIENLSRNSMNRRIIGSPRQLENAVATNKNPHGVWV